MFVGLSLLTYLFPLAVPVSQQQLKEKWWQREWQPPPPKTSMKNKQPPCCCCHPKRMMPSSVLPLNRNCHCHCHSQTANLILRQRAMEDQWRALLPQRGPPIQVSLTVSRGMMLRQHQNQVHSPCCGGIARQRCPSVIGNLGAANLSATASAAATLDLDNSAPSNVPQGSLPPCCLRLVPQRHFLCNSLPPRTRTNNQRIVFNRICCHGRPV
mmetsp:Transcript_6971/g.15039  ORF Transcript_6971/g.15039 Transcript_6971/m.15039 type:complete len:212 (-) Transcript_6971:719-1354(-)